MVTGKIAGISLLFSIVATLQAQTVIPASKPLSAMSENGANVAANANDNNASTRWESRYGAGISDTQWIMADLGSAQSVDQVQISNDRTFASWSLIGSVA
jgi:hypothetical protein